MTIAPESPTAVGSADVEAVDLTEPSLTGSTSEPVEPVDLAATATSVVHQAIAAGSTEVALRYLELETQRDIARRKRRQTWILAVLGAALVVALVGGVLAFQSMQGGNTGEAAPEPLGFGDAATVPLGDSVPVDDSAGAALEGDGAALDPAAGTEVLGATETAGADAGVTATPAPGASSGGLALPAAPRSGTTPGASSGASNGAAPPTSAPRAGSPASGAPAAGSPPAAPAPTAPAPTAPAAPAVGALDGNWSVIGGSQAGYRVSKRWTLTGDSEEVVGRTARVSGTMAIAQDRVNSTGIVIDMASVDSANGIRDAAYRQDILNTAAHPTARFDLTAPIDIRARPPAGTVFTTSASGRLTIRGVTRDVTVQLQARQSGGSIQVVGSIPVTFADFGIASPNLPIVTVANQGTIEFQVNLAR